jgi:Methane oxygenase PmoA
MIRKPEPSPLLRKSLFLAICLAVSSAGLHAQRVAAFKVTLPADVNGLDIPVRAGLDVGTPSHMADSTFLLFELWHGERIPTPFQVEETDRRFLHWIVKYRNDRGLSRDYELMQGHRGNMVNLIKPVRFTEVMANMDDQSLTIQNGDQKLLRYWYGTVYPPAGVDSSFRRSGFIHPLWTPRGQELTRIQPPDHRHHYGLWNPWTHVLFEKDTVDFWNLGDKKGTVRFAKFISVTNGPVYAEFQVLHEHVVFKKDGSQRVALNELQTVRVYRPADSGNYYIMDITSRLGCATQSPVLLLTYRYGGLGWRATEVWNKDNSEVLTSEGKDRKTADGSTARWCIVQGSLDSLAPGKYGDYGGALMLSYPTNYNHPEPLRIWPENSNGRGDLFANFDPTKDRDWLLVPGKTYTLRYRLLVFNGKFNKETAESAWQCFATPPAISLVDQPMR